MYINGYSWGRIECMCIGHTGRTTSNFALHVCLSVLNLLCVSVIMLSVMYTGILCCITHFILPCFSTVLLPITVFFGAFWLKCYTIELFCECLHCVYHHHSALSDGWTQPFGISQLAACWVEWGVTAFCKEEAMRNRSTISWFCDLNSTVWYKLHIILCN